MKQLVRNDGGRQERDGDTPAKELATRLVGVGGGTVRAVLLYGSHLLRPSSDAPDRHSAIDLVVLVDDYRTFYHALHSAGELPRPTWLMTALANVLPPNVIAFAPDEGRSFIAKCLVVSTEHFERALGPDPKDHFLLGRMIQKVGLVWSRDAQSAAWVGAQLRTAYDHVLDWMAPYLDDPFDAEELGRRLLEVCYQGELRPESTSRADQIFRAQSDHFARVFRPVLEGAVAGHVLESRLDGYHFVEAPSAGDVRRWRWHFRVSKARATARWLKHTLTFANWLPYVVRKVERHTGREIHLTTLERKLPLIFLWPRAVHVLLTRPAGEGD